MRIIRDIAWGLRKPRLVRCDDCGELRLEGKPHEITGCPNENKQIISLAAASDR